MPALQWQVAEILNILRGASDQIADSLTVSSKTVKAAAALTAAPCYSVIIQADSGNTEDILIGNSTAQTVILSATQPLSMHVSNADIIYLKSADPDTSVKANYIVLNKT